MSVFTSSRSPTTGGNMYMAGSKGATVIKARYGGDIRRMPIINEELTYDDLILMMQRVFKLTEKDSVLVKYTDDDGDLVTILDDGDLSHAKTYGSVLRLTLFVNGKGPTINASAQLQSELLAMSKAVAKLTDKLNQLEPETTATTETPAPRTDSTEADGKATAATGTKSESAPRAVAARVDFGKELDPLAASPAKQDPLPVEPSPTRPAKPIDTVSTVSAPSDAGGGGGADSVASYSQYSESHGYGQAHTTQGGSHSGYAQGYAQPTAAATASHDAYAQQAQGQQQHAGYGQHGEHYSQQGGSGGDQYHQSSAHYAASSPAATSDHHGRESSYFHLSTGHVPPSDYDPGYTQPAGHAGQPQPGQGQAHGGHYQASSSAYYQSGAGGGSAAYDGSHLGQAYANTYEK